MSNGAINRSTAEVSGMLPTIGQRQIKGSPERVILRGQTLVKDGAFFGVPGQGKWIDRPQLAAQPRGTSQEPAP